MIKPCKECGKDFEAKSNAQKFCSDQCKMDAAMKAGGNEVKKASEVKQVTKDLKTVAQPIKSNDWVKQIEDYCDKNGLIPQDLIDFHKGLKKPERKEKKLVEQSDSQVPIIARNKQMQEPEKGTNAYFLRYGKWE